MFVAALVIWGLFLVLVGALFDEYLRWSHRKQAGASRPTTTLRWREEPSAVAMGGTTPGSLASPLPTTTQDSLQALGNLARTVLYRVERYSGSGEPEEGLLLQCRTLAQAVVDLASTSPRQATPVSAELEQGPATSGSRSSSERIRAYPVRTVTAHDEVPLGRPMNDY